MEFAIRPAACIALSVYVGLLAGCGTSFRDCSEEDASAAESLPDTLSQTGLYRDIAGDLIADNVIEFTPRFPLWTDGASKRRWLQLPEGATVDTRNAEAWVLPVGTRTFKEFTLDGVRLETRMNLRTEQGWTGVSYVWNEAGDDATRQLTRAEDVKGTTHDIPSAQECLVCHAGRANFTLGFSATQLDVETRRELHQAGVLSDPVETELDLPADALAGLGVLHGNCSHCHNSERADLGQATECFDPGSHDPFDLSLPSDLSDVERAPALMTARFFVGQEGDSEVLHRMSRRNRSERRPSMPPVGTEVVDEEGLAKVEGFVRGFGRRR